MLGRNGLVGNQLAETLYQFHFRFFHFFFISFFFLELELMRKLNIYHICNLLFSHGDSQFSILQVEMILQFLTQNIIIKILLNINPYFSIPTSLLLLLIIEPNNPPQKTL